MTVGVVSQPAVDAERYRCACLHCAQGLAAGRGDGHQCGLDWSVLVGNYADNVVTAVRVAAFHAALNAMRRSRVRDSRGNMVTEYQLINSLHQFREAPGAHDGPAFLVWHAEYIFRLVS